MKKRNLTHSAVRHALMTGVALTAVSCATTVSAANTETPAQLGKVTVTGTRIKRTDIETAQPITRISRQQIQRSGYTNVGKLLGRLSFSGAFANTTQQYGSNATQVNLRNLGANRNLVLVNGKRWIQGLGGTTNLNTIPTSIIDHIEILQDGASAVYGSDAISGVVNIITVKKFKGAEAHAYYGIRNDSQTGYWDGQVRQYDFTVGSGNDRGNVVFNATYRKHNGSWKSNHRITRNSVVNLNKFVGPTSSVPRPRVQLFGPAVSGRTFDQGSCGAYDPRNPTQTLCDLTLQNFTTSDSPRLSFRNFQPSDQYYHNHDRLLAHPGKTVSTYVQGHYDLFDNVTFTANAAYIRDESAVRSPGEDIKVGATSSKLLNGVTPVGIAASNPYNPFGVDLVADASDPCIAAGTCIGLGNIYRQLLEGGLHVGTFDRDSFHIFAGFNGYVNLFNREIDWDVGFAQNRVQNVNITDGDANIAREVNALGSASQCTSPCVPFDLFGGLGSITQNQLNYLTYEYKTITQSNLRDWTANISSDVYDLPAGPLGLAVGWERIDNYGFFRPDAIQIQGNDNDYNAKPTRGRVVRDAEYAELNIPLLADLPGVKNLSVDIANRWTQFQRSGGVNGNNSTTFVHNSSGRLNIRYQVISDLLLRASWSQGFRSPNVNELFGGVGGTYQKIVDPCADGAFGGYTGGPLPANCPNGTEDVQPAPNVNGTSGSNANLQPEKSISRTLGFVYSPSQVPGLDLNADYYKIELTNAVGSIGDQGIINGCFNNSSYCNLLTTRNNQITSIFNVSTNFGDTLTEGIDVGIHYKFPSTPVGDFDARISGTFLKTFDQTQVNLATKTGFATSHLAGVSEYPKRRFNGYLNWDYGNWSARYDIEYISSVVDRCGESYKGYCTYPNRTTDYQGAPGVFSLGRNHLGATVYHDVHVSYTVPSIHTTFGLGVQNLFDKKPPITGTGGIVGGFDGAIYRQPSRLIYGSIRARF